MAVVGINSASRSSVFKLPPPSRQLAAVAGDTLLGSLPPAPFAGPRLLAWLLSRFRRQEASLLMVERALQVQGCMPSGVCMHSPAGCAVIYSREKGFGVGGRGKGGGARCLADVGFLLASHDRVRVGPILIRFWLNNIKRLVPLVLSLLTFISPLRTPDPYRPTAQPPVERPCCRQQ